MAAAPAASRGVQRYAGVRSRPLQFVNAINKMAPTAGALRVLFGQWSGTDVKIDGVEYLIMKESDIMGVLTEAEASKKAA
jgi:hypothetical protein